MIPYEELVLECVRDRVGLYTDDPFNRLRQRLLERFAEMPEADRRDIVNQYVQKKMFLDLEADEALLLRYVPADEVAA